MARSYDYLFKLVLMGDRGTDKSGLMDTFCYEYPRSLMRSVDAEFTIRNIELDSMKIKLQLWDTDSQYRFRTITSKYIRGARGLMFVYDITNRASFESITQRYNQEIENYKTVGAVVMIVGNKCHLENLRQVSIEEGRLLAEELGYLFFEVSSEMDVNVEPAFVTLAQAIKEKTERKSFLPRN